MPGGGGQTQYDDEMARYQKEVNESKVVYFGWAFVEKNQLGQIYQTAKDLIRDVKKSDIVSEQKRERDNSLQLSRFRELLRDIAYVFRNPDSK